MMSEQYSPLSDPSPEDPAAWSSYWQAQNQSWRTEPEIATERQAYLIACLRTPPDVPQGIYPFRAVQLSRADVEWLLARHKGGSVDWSEASEREREGIDVRGADLRDVDLRGLPLACLVGGLSYTAWDQDTWEAQVEGAGANLHGVHLEGATLGGAHLEQAELAKRIWSEPI
jgi:Pentapeptide repeats (8 copies)